MTPRCPLCNGQLEAGPGVITEEYHPGYHVAGRDLPTRERHITVTSCSACEFCAEIHSPPKGHKPP